MIIVDTCIWIDHLRQEVAELSEALDNQKVLMHPFVLGEIALGSLPNRETVLEEMKLLPFPLIASDQEVMDMIEAKKLAGFGVGFIDVHLVASALITEETQLWTRDKRLYAVARRLGVAYPSLH